jgi:hypothetical protein
MMMDELLEALHEAKRWEYAAMHCSSRFKSERDVLAVKNSVDANIFAHNSLHGRTPTARELANDVLVQWKGEIDSRRIALGLPFPDDYDRSPKYAVQSLIDASLEPVKVTEAMVEAGLRAVYGSMDMANAVGATLHDGARTIIEAALATVQPAEPPFPLQSLVPGITYESPTHGSATYVGPDDFMGQRTYKFTTPHGTIHLLPEVLGQSIWIAPQSSEPTVAHWREAFWWVAWHPVRDESDAQRLSRVEERARELKAQEPPR